MSIKYSIIIPHKNIPQLLKRCLQSIPKREDTQIIVVDDNSDSENLLLHVLSEYNNANTEIYLTKEGKGAGYARNVGLSHAKGKWVLFADSDDFFTDNFTSIIDQYYDSNYDVILFPIKNVDSQTLNPSDRDLWINETIQKTTLTKKEKLASVICPYSKLIRREFINSHNLQYEEIPFSNDYMFGLHLAMDANAIHIDNNHYIYTLTVRQGSLVTIKDRKALRCRLETEFRAYRFLKEKQHSKIMSPINKRYLTWASEIDKIEVLRTAWKLFTNGLLFYTGSQTCHYKYYSSGWYNLYKALTK